MLSDSSAAQSPSTAGSCSLQPVISPFPKSEFKQGKSKSGVDAETAGLRKAALPQVPDLAQVLRAFDKPDDGLVYQNGSIMNVPVAEPGNLIKPLHRLCLLDLAKKKNLLRFGIETMQFACACLNDRRNGTLHFGINSVEGSGGSQGAHCWYCFDERQNYR